VSSGSCLASMAVGSVAIDEFWRSVLCSGQRRRSGLSRLVSAPPPPPVVSGLG
jgi:hypothetical protein